MYTLLMVYIFVGPVQSDHVFSGVVSIFLFQIDSCIASVGMVRWFESFENSLISSVLITNVIQIRHRNLREIGTNNVTNFDFFVYFFLLCFVCFDCVPIRVRMIFRVNLIAQQMRIRIVFMFDVWFQISNGQWDKLLRTYTQLNRIFSRKYN